MDALERAHSTFAARVDEIVQNARIRQAFDGLFVRRRQLVFSQQIDKQLRVELDGALLLGKSDASVLYRGLLVQLNGAFEAYITQLSVAVVNGHKGKTTRYSELPEHLRQAYVVNSANVLAKISEGVVHGVAYDFAALQKSLGTCFSDIAPYSVDAEVFTLFMGNCTPERLEKLFKVVGISPAFDDELGKNPHVKRWAQNAGAREASKRARQKLSDEIKRRNQIAHRGADLAILPAEIIEIADFFKALGAAFENKAREAIA